MVIYIKDQFTAHDGVSGYITLSNGVHIFYSHAHPIKTKKEAEQTAQIILKSLNQNN